MCWDARWEKNVQVPLHAVNSRSLSLSLSLFPFQKEPIAFRIWSTGEGVIVSVLYTTAMGRIPFVGDLKWDWGGVGCAVEGGGGECLRGLGNAGK